MSSKQEWFWIKRNGYKVLKIWNGNNWVFKQEVVNIRNDYKEEDIIDNYLKECHMDIYDIFEDRGYTYYLLYGDTDGKYVDELEVVRINGNNIKVFLKKE